MRVLLWPLYFSNQNSVRYSIGYTACKTLVSPFQSIRLSQPQFHTSAIYPSFCVRAVQTDDFTSRYFTLLYSPPL